jgi:hypothetical protein
MQLARQLDKAAADFMRQIGAIAKARQEVVVPFCRKHDLHFASVNGECYFLRGDDIVYTCDYDFGKDGQLGNENAIPALVHANDERTRCRLSGAARVARTLLTPIPIYDDAVPGYSQHLHNFMADYAPHPRRSR